MRHPHELDMPLAGSFGLAFRGDVSVLQDVKNVVGGRYRREFKLSTDPERGPQGAGTPAADAVANAVAPGDRVASPATNSVTTATSVPAAGTASGRNGNAGHHLGLTIAAVPGTASGAANWTIARGAGFRNQSDHITVTDSTHATAVKEVVVTRNDSPTQPDKIAPTVFFRSFRPDGHLRNFGVQHHTEWIRFG